MRRLRRLAVVGTASFLFIATPIFAAISPQAHGISATAGSQFSGQVAAFTSNDPQPFRVVISWGDRTRDSAGTATCTNCPAPRGTYRVDGSHTWASAGTYTVHVTITSSKGTSSVDSTATVGAAAPSGRAPVAALAIPAPVRLRQAVRFDASSSQGGGLTYHWDFDGSGAFATDGGRSPTIFHAFTKPGDQKVQVRVTNASGSSVATGTANVLAPPKPHLTFKTRVAKGKPLRFTFPVKNPKGVHTLFWQWTFGDGAPVPHRLGPYTVPNAQPTATDTVTHRWTKPGKFTVQGSAVDSAGGVTTLAVGVQVCTNYRQLESTAATNPCASPPGSFKPTPVGISFEDGPVAGETEYFTIGAIFKAGTDDQIEQQCSHDVVTGKPIFCLGGDSGSSEAVNLVITWDFGDGTTDTGGVGDASHTYNTPGTYPITLTLSYPDKGVSETAHATLHVMPPAICGPVDVHGFEIRPESGCLSAHPVGGKPLYQTDDNVGVRVDGILFKAKNVGVDFDSGALVGVWSQLVPTLGSLNLAPAPGYTLPASGQADIPIAKGTYEGGSTIAGGDVFLDPNGTATFAPVIALQKPFVGTAAATPTPVPKAGGVASPPDEFTISQPDGMSYLGVGIENLSLTHHAGGSWTGTGDLALPGGLSISLGPGGPAGFPAQRGIGLNPLYLGARADFPPGAVPVAGLFYLDHVGVQISTAGTLRLSGDVGITTMPALNLFGIALAKVNGCVDMIDYQTSGPESIPLCDGTVYKASEPDFYLHVHGNLSVLSIGFANAYFDFHSTGPTVAFGGAFNYPFAGGAFSIDGSLNGQFASFSEWQLGPFGVHGCEHIIGDECLGVTALISSRGVVGCVDILGWNVGAWYRWSGAWGVVSHACGVGSSGHVALGSYSLATLPGMNWPLDGERRVEASVPLKGGLPFAMIAVKGTGGAPLVDVRGPGGIHLVDNGQDRQHTGPGKTAILRSKRFDTTYVFIDHPARGSWLVTAQGGSAPISDVSEADGLAKPAVTAHVAGSGRARTLEYRVTPEAGQKVVFVEQGKAGAKLIGTASGKAGRIHFTPADAAGGTRKILALVAEGDLPRTTLTVAQYAAPGPLVPAQPRGLRAHAQGTKLVVSWRKSAGATAYRVAMKLGDGRVLTLTPRTTSVAVPRYRAGTGATVSVAAQTASGRLGKAALLTVKRHPRKPKPLVL